MCRQSIYLDHFYPCSHVLSTLTSFAPPISFAFHQLQHPLIAAKMQSFGTLKALVLAILVAFTVASPLVARTGITGHGNLRPVALVTRGDAQVKDLAARVAQTSDSGSEDSDSSDDNSGTGSTSSSSSLGGSSASSQSSSGETSTTSSSSCRTLSTRLHAKVDRAHTDTNA